MVAKHLKLDERDPKQSVWVLDERKLRKERGERVKGSEKERDEGFEMQRL